MSGQAQTTSVIARFKDTSPVPAARRDTSFFGEPQGATGLAFVPPTPNKANVAASIWQRLKMLDVPFAEPLGIGENSPSMRRGLIVIDTAFPVGSGINPALADAETAADGFHRTNLSNLHCHDKRGPRFWKDPDFAQWQFIQYTIPLTIFDDSDTYVEDGYVR